MRWAGPLALLATVALTVGSTTTTAVAGNNVKNTDPAPTKSPSPNATKIDPKLESFEVDLVDTSDKEGKHVTAHRVKEIGLPDKRGLRTVTDKTLDPGTGAVVKAEVSTTREVNPTGGDATPPTTAAPGTVTAASSGSGGCCSAEGWRWLNVRTNGYSTLGSLVWTWNVGFQYGWGGGVPGVSWGYVRDQWHPRPSFTNVSGCCYIVRGEPAWETEFFYGWASMNYSWHTGWSYQAKGQIENCVLHFGCVGTSYPRINLFAHANGTYYWSTTG
ncbi:MAG: hypothetical protein ACR2LJ_09910 [Acidimicrobiales bacterium]